MENTKNPNPIYRIWLTSVLIGLIIDQNLAHCTVSSGSDLGSSDPDQILNLLSGSFGHEVVSPDTNRGNSLFDHYPNIMTRWDRQGSSTYQVTDKLSCVFYYKLY